MRFGSWYVAVVSTLVTALFLLTVTLVVLRTLDTRRAHEYDVVKPSCYRALVRASLPVWDNATIERVCGVEASKVVDYAPMAYTCFTAAETTLPKTTMYRYERTVRRLCERVLPPESWHIAVDP